MNKTIYKIFSHQPGTPSYRVYNYFQAQGLLQAVCVKFPEKEFWLEVQKRRTDNEN